MNISVIIPVYNIESYLESTLKSLLDQTYKDFEVILVNDGSVDRSPDICDEYAAKLRLYINQTEGSLLQGMSV